MALTKVLVGQDERIRIALDTDAGRPVLIVTIKDTGEQSVIVPTDLATNALLNALAPF